MTKEDQQKRGSEDSKEQKKKKEISPQRDPQKNDPPKRK